ncbi:MAG: acyl carrier protein [Gemmiger sp.]|uniref:acyl carrier protein n=1 Tax=Gemmiger sp. TaxID=2049027 RepID=UPI002E77BB7F|nr:acyl carrier protein [Gemmiger sp.]MEE0799704.1 acyl carrier protein [Gemmiger sp.]
MKFADLLEILAEQFSCDAAELSEETTFEDLGVDSEDLVELAWQLGEATGVELAESRLASIETIGELWNLVRELEEEAE